MTLVTVSVVLLLGASSARGQDIAVDSASAALAEASTALRAGNYLQALPLATRAVELAEKGDDRALLGARAARPRTGALGPRPGRARPPGSPARGHALPRPE